MSLHVVTRIAALRAQRRAWRGAGESLALVPTMGNLHAGHLRLVERARQEADRVAVSIFVNPLQFGPGEDLDAYPRTLEQDQERLQAAGADLLFAPAERELYPRGREGLCKVRVPGLSEDLCGRHRPGHFTGVTTVVAKLFHLFEPEVAVFGEKDYQQLVVIRRMVEDLNFPVRIVGVPTVREADGLAMSSRNAYLDAGERLRAPALYRALVTAAEALAAGAETGAVQATALEELAAAGLEPEYVAVRRAGDLGPVTADSRDLVVLGAARLGRARLIDNVRVTRGTATAPLI